MVDFKRLGARLRAWRKAEGLNQSQAAERLATSQQSISQYENGFVTSMDVVMMKRICDAVGAKITDFFLEPEEEAA